MAIELRDPKDVSIECQDGTFRTYRIGKFPAITGREIITQYPVTAAPKVGDYATNNELMLKAMQFVETEDGIRLKTAGLIDNHVPDAEALLRLEYALLEYNCSFFGAGRMSGILAALAGKFQGLITEILTDLTPASSQKGSAHSANSANTTRSKKR